MRYPSSEKLEIIRLVEGSHLPAKRTLKMLGVPRATFYRWYDRYQAFGEAGFEDRRPHPGRVSIGIQSGPLMECAPRVGQIERLSIDRVGAF